MSARSISLNLLAAALLAASGLAHADLGFPDSVKLPAQIVVNPDQRLIKEALADGEFESGNTGARMGTPAGRSASNTGTGPR